MQKNYISKEQAEVQLENELQQLRLQNGQKIKEMEDKHSRELLERTKEVADRKQQEFNIIQEGLRSMFPPHKPLSEYAHQWLGVHADAIIKQSDLVQGLLP